MALTPEGSPYVESTDLVANYPAASLSLANRVDLVGVLPFADAAARTAAIPSPTDGQFTYLQDTNTPEFYDGSVYKPVSGGKILQIVQGITSASVTTTSTGAYVTTGLTAAITPSAVSSKVLIIANITGNMSSTAVMYVTAFRGTVAGTNLSSAGGAASMSQAYNTGGVIISALSVNYLDSPATTSSQTYTIGFKVSGGTGVVQSANDSMSTITLMEVAA
jgi:hypothetical protein